MFTKRCSNGFGDLLKGLLTFATTLNTPVTGRAKGNILILSTQFAWLAMIVIAASNNASVNFTD